MLLPSSGSLEGDVIAAVGEDGLSYVCTQCGRNFSLADLKQRITAMPECAERRVLESVARVVESAHQKLTGYVQGPDTEARST